MGLVEYKREVDPEHIKTAMIIAALVRLPLWIVSVVQAFENPMTSLALSAALFVSYYDDRKPVYVRKNETANP